MATETKPKRKPRTIKEKRYVKAIVTGEATDHTQAARIAGYTDPAQSGWENKQKLDFNYYFAKAGLTDEAIAANITEASYANDEILNVPDWQIRLKAHDLALKVMGKFAPVKSDITSLGEKITIPILGGDSAVHPDNRDQQDTQPEKTD